MLNIAILLAVTLTVAAGSWLWQRRHQGAALGAGSEGSDGAVPTHLRRADFVSPESPWLIAAFSSASCLACAEVWRQVQGFESASVAICEIEHGTEPKVHTAYGIDSVPTTVIVDTDGAVRAGFVGPLSAQDLDKIADLVTRTETTSSG